jgi:hypothetical protein
MKEVRLTAFFPESQYQRNGAALELSGFGTGSTLAIAMNRAFRSMLENPQMRYKVPKWIYVSVATEGMGPIRFWDILPAPTTDPGPPKKS